MRQRLFITTIAVLICVISSYAQGLYSKSLSVTELKGVWTNGTVTVETDNAIASTKKSDYVKSHLYEYKNIVLMTTEKMEYKDKTYYIWEIMYDTEGIKAGESPSWTGSPRTRSAPPTSRAMSSTPCAATSRRTTESSSTARWSSATRPQSSRAGNPSP